MFNKRTNLDNYFNIIMYFVSFFIKTVRASFQRHFSKVSAFAHDNHTVFKIFGVYTIILFI